MVENIFNQNQCDLHIWGILKGEMPDFKYSQIIGYTTVHDLNYEGGV